MSATAFDDEPVVVIGSGPCGAAAAHQLVSRGVDVLMLDSGDAAPTGLLVRGAGNILFRRYGWGHYSNDRHVDDTGTVDWYSSLSLGGLSNFWTAAVPRFAPDDFTEGGRLDERYVWPVRYDDVAPFYELAERLLKVTVGDDIAGVPPGVGHRRHRLPADWSAVAEAAARNGEGVGVIPMAYGDRWMFARRATEFSSYQCVVEPLLQSPRFQLRGGAHVSRLSWNAKTGAVDAVEFVDRHSGRTEKVRARAVIVAAGAIDSTAILLRSTSDDFPSGLGNSAGLLGRYLTDHPREWWQASLDRPMRALAHPVYIARRAHADSDPLMATSQTVGLTSPVERLRTYVGRRTSTVGVQVFGTQVPKPDVGVTLEPGDDPVHQRPRISLAYDDAALRNLISGRDRFRDVMRDAGLSTEILNPGHELRPGSSVHFAGTVRMHADPQFGMLDSWNRMYDVPNVAVADMSCFTTNPEKNPTLTAMALAIRAADHLADDVD